MKLNVQLTQATAFFTLLLLYTAGFPAWAGPAIDKITIDKESAAKIVSTYSDKKKFTKEKIQDFTDFLSAISQNKNYQQYSPFIDSYLTEKSLSQDNQKIIFRLLGLYTSIKYGDQAIELLKTLVNFPTFKPKKIDQHNNPSMIKMGKKLADVAKEFNLHFKNIDNRVFEITLGGEKKDVIAVHAHGDVLPANKDLWQLEDGTQLDPFTVTTIGNRMYGRGTEDDKNGIVVSLFAMKVIREENLPRLNTLRLLVDTTEESGSSIPYYLSKYPTPPYNLALDGSYPIVIAEKGYGVVMANFPVRKGRGTGAEIISLTGGLATNQIPKAATATLHTANSSATTPTQLKRLKTKIDHLARPYIATHGGNFSIRTTEDGKQLRLSVIGVSAHSSQPKSGVNPVSRLLDFIVHMRQTLDIKANHITDAAQYAADNWGLDYKGNKLGIGYRHEFMGPLTAALTYIHLDKNTLQLAVNLRIPEGKALEVLKKEITEKISNWKLSQNKTMQVDYRFSKPMYRNPKGKWVNALLDIASENLGIERKFGSSAGGTSIHNLPNGVQFGLSVPEVKYSGHNANEFKTIDQFLLDLQIVTEALVTLGNLTELQ